MLDQIMHDIDADTNFEDLMEEEVPCELGIHLKSNSPGTAAPWCSEKAEWRLVIRCNRCGNAKQTLVCDGCRKFIHVVSKIIRTVLYFNKTKCSHSVRHKKMTWVLFKG